jgi:hypothetical protein
MDEGSDHCEAHKNKQRGFPPHARRKEQRTGPLRGNSNGGHKAPTGTRCVLLYFNPNQYRVFEKVMHKHHATRGSRGWGGKEAVLEELMRTDLRNSQG